MDNRETLAMFVAGGNLRNVEPTPAMDPQVKRDILQRLQMLREGGPITPDDAAPSDFREALSTREALAHAKARERWDVPRWHADNALMKQVYRAHDTMASMPTPAGIGVILLIILVFFLVLIPVSTGGPTRMLLLWDVLLGSKKLPAIDRNAVGIVENNTPDKGWNPVTGADTGATAPASMGSMPTLNIESVYLPFDEVL